jgi:hypothetical protein
MQKEPSVSDLPRRFYRETYNPLKAGSIDGTDVKPHDHAVYRAMHAHCLLFLHRNPDNFFLRFYFSLQILQTKIQNKKVILIVLYL